MTIAISISKILDTLLADSAVMCREGAGRLLTHDEIPALTMLARLVFARTVLKLNETGRVNDFDDDSDNDGDIMTLDVDCADVGDETNRQRAIVSNLSLAITWRIMEAVADDPARARSYATLADDAVTALCSALCGDTPRGSLRPHWH